MIDFFLKVWQRVTSAMTGNPPLVTPAFYLLLQVKLPEKYELTRIAIQGRNSSYAGMFTRRFQLHYAQGGVFKIANVSF